MKLNGVYSKIQINFILIVDFILVLLVSNIVEEDLFVGSPGFSFISTAIIIIIVYFIFSSSIILQNITEIVNLTIFYCKHIIKLFLIPIIILSLYFLGNICILFINTNNLVEEFVSSMIIFPYIVLKHILSTFMRSDLSIFFSFCISLPIAILFFYYISRFNMIHYIRIIDKMKLNNIEERLNHKMDLLSEELKLINTEINSEKENRDINLLPIKDLIVKIVQDFLKRGFLCSIWFILNILTQNLLLTSFIFLIIYFMSFNKLLVRKIDVKTSINYYLLVFFNKTNNNTKNNELATLSRYLIHNTQDNLTVFMVERMNLKRLGVELINKLKIQIQIQKEIIGNSME